MDFALNPKLYQLTHPWHWLTYGDNATAFGIVLAAVLNLATIYVLYRTLRAVNKQAIAADRQAEAAEQQASAARKQTEVAEQQRIASERAATAAEQQVMAAKSSAAVSDAQRIATEAGAQAEREHSNLIRQQTLASLRPFIALGRQPHPTMGGSLEYFAANHGQGVALDVVCSYRNTPNESLPLVQNILGAGQKALLGLHLQRATTAGLIVRYKSQDGRFFVTNVKVGAGQDFAQETFEVDDKGGFIAW